MGLSPDVTEHKTSLRKCIEERLLSLGFSHTPAACGQNKVLPGSYHPLPLIFYLVMRDKSGKPYSHLSQDRVQKSSALPKAT